MDAWYKLLAKECREKRHYRLYPSYHDGILDFVDYHIARFYPISRQIGISINHMVKDDPYGYPHTHLPWYQSTILEGAIREVRDGETFIWNKGDTYYVDKEIHHQVFPIEPAWSMMLFHGPSLSTTEFLTKEGIRPAYDVIFKEMDIKEVLLPSDYENPFPGFKVKTTIIQR
jgi:hypothetical protein